MIDCFAFPLFHQGCRSIWPKQKERLKKKQNTNSFNFMQRLIFYHN